jgi:hypothetical protein
MNKPSISMIGLALVMTGAILLIVSYLVGWTDYNFVQFCGLGMIIAGIITWIIGQKKNK